MEQTSSIPNPDHTRSRLMQAASKLFAEKGYTGTTAHAIAELAEVNEVTLFRHFGTFEARFSGNYIQDLTLIGYAMMKVMPPQFNCNWLDIAWYSFCCPWWSIAGVC